MFLRPEGRNESNSHQLPPTSQMKNFHEQGVHHEQLARIGENKIFYEYDTHHVYKVGIKRCWAQEAKITVTANSSRESERRKSFMKTTHIMSRKSESNVFAPRRPK